jgi:ribonuclease BN (tRNA processing enzyme)
MRHRSLKCFGVGDGWPSANRNHASFLYRIGKVSLLIDCGDSVSRSFKATNLSYDAIDRVFISHLHADHFGGFFMLMQAFWLEGRKKALPVSLPAGGLKPVSQMLTAGMIFPELLGFKLRLEPIKDGQPVMAKGVRVTPFRTSHLDDLKQSFQKKYPLDFDAFCFLIEADGLRIGHSGDLGSPKDLEPLLKKPLDLLVCELSHFKREDLFAFLKGRAVKRVVLVHLARSYWKNLAETRRLAAKMLPNVPFSIAGDQEEIQF